MVVMSAGLAGSRRRPQRRDTRHVAVGLGGDHVLRERQVRDAAAGVGRRDRLVDDGRRMRRRGDRLGVERHVAEQQVRVGHLDEVDAAMDARHVAGEREDRRMVPRRFVEAGYQMRAAGAGGARADAEAAGQLGLTGGGERGALLVAHADPFNLAAPHRVSERVQGIADQAEDLPDPDLFEHADQDVGYHSSHVSLLQSLRPLRWVARGRSDAALAPCEIVRLLIKSILRADPTFF
jgi:hypothetical protein